MTFAATTRWTSTAESGEPVSAIEDDTHAGRKADHRKWVTWQVLTNEHRFGVYFIGAALSNFGNWCQSLAGILLVYRLTQSVFIVGLASVCQFIWPIVLGPWTGMVADRFNRRTVLIVTQVTAAVVSGVLAVLTMTELVDVPVALAAIALLGVLQSFQAPAQLALVPLLVAREHRELGLSLSSSQFNLARAIGPVIASGLILVGDLGTPFLFNSASFIVFVVLLRFTRPLPQEMPKERPRLRHTLAAVMSERALLPLLAIGFVVSGSTDSVSTIGPAISVELTGTDTWAGGFIAGFGAGATVGAFWLVPLLQRVRRRLPWTIGAQALGALLFAMAPAPGYALAGCVVFGAGFILSSNRALSTVQSLISPELFGRVMAVWLMAFLGGRAFYALVGGAIANASGPRVAALVVVGTIALAAIGGWMLGSRKRTPRTAVPPDR
ncbi:MFS transporter [Nonomuraea sp. NPDC005650]|uniref:MFS transporter n=1 Tax=Nonomuraea sp. NPDC005650 TaxID=3157045 RepID=UPI0033B79875